MFGQTKRIIRRLYAMLLFACLIPSLVACSSRQEKAELLVSSAVSLKDALNEIRSEFEKKHPGTRVLYNFGASGQLAQQILQGAPADVFISASHEQMASLIQKDLIAKETVHSCASNRLAVMAPNGHTFDRMEDLGRVQRLAIGDPKTVPVGEYARQALEKAKLYDTLKAQTKLVFAQDASQVLAYIEGGDVDAGIVYSTDALLAKKSKLCFYVSPDFTKPMTYEIGALKKGPQGELAQEFITFVQGPAAREALQKRGFEP